MPLVYAVVVGWLVASTAYYVAANRATLEQALPLIRRAVVLCCLCLFPICIIGTAYLTMEHRGWRTPREQVMVENLAVLRGALWTYQWSHDRYPARLEDLVKGGYLSELPVSPIKGDIIAIPDSCELVGGWFYNPDAGEVCSASAGGRQLFAKKYYDEL